MATTPLQALNLLNDGFVHDQADRFAERLRHSADGIEAQVRLAFRLAFGRDASATELPAAKKLAEAHGLPALCRALFNANEFIVME